MSYVLSSVFKSKSEQYLTKVRISLDGNGVNLTKLDNAHINTEKMIYCSLRIFSGCIEFITDCKHFLSQSGCINMKRFCDKFGRFADIGQSVHNLFKIEPRSFKRIIAYLCNKCINRYVKMLLRFDNLTRKNSVNCCNYTCNFQILLGCYGRISVVFQVFSVVRKTCNLRNSFLLILRISNRKKTGKSNHKRQHS